MKKRGGNLQMIKKKRKKKKEKRKEKTKNGEVTEVSSSTSFPATPPGAPWYPASSPQASQSPSHEKNIKQRQYSLQLLYFQVSKDTYEYPSPLYTPSQCRSLQEDPSETSTYLQGDLEKEGRPEGRKESGSWSNGGWKEKEQKYRISKLSLVIKNPGGTGSSPIGNEANWKSSKINNNKKN